MKLIFTIFCIVIFAIVPDTKFFQTNKYVAVEMRFPKTVSVKEELTIAFFLTPNEGIHINTTPAFNLTMSKNSLFEVSGKPDFKKKESGYLDSDSPIIFHIKIKNLTSQGKRNLNGTLNYFYCSDAEGWCNRFSQPFKIPVEVTQ